MSGIGYKTYIVRCKLHSNYIGIGLYKHCATTTPSKQDLDRVYKHIEKCAANLMGFKHKLDYKKSYPGKYSVDSDSMSKIFEGYGCHNTNSIEKYIKQRYPIDVWAAEGNLDELKILYDHEFKDKRQNSLIAFINVNDLELAFPEVQDKQISYKWFCKDWGGVKWLQENDEYYFDGKYSEDDLTVIDATPIWVLEELERHDLDEGIHILLDFETIYGTEYTIKHFNPDYDESGLVVGRYDNFYEFVDNYIESEFEEMWDVSSKKYTDYMKELKKDFVMGKKYGYIFYTHGISVDEAKRMG